MKKDRINAVADRIEASASDFCMLYYNHECGAPACIAGYALAMYAPEFNISPDGGADYLDISIKLADVLDISYIDAMRISNVDDYWLFDIDAEWAGAMLRRLAETGMVDWRGTLPKGKMALTKGFTNKQIAELMEAVLV